MTSALSTPSSAQKPRRSHLDEFLPLYKKFGESNASSKTCKNHELSGNEVRNESPKHQLTSSKQTKQAVDISQITIDGTNLNYSGGNSTPLNQSKVTYTPVVMTNSAKADKKLKRYTSTIEHSTVTDNLSPTVTTPKSQKRSKSVSFLLEEKDQAVFKKVKSNDSQDSATGDTAQKIKKLKNNKKSEKENKAVAVDEPVYKKKDKKNKDKSQNQDHSISVNVNSVVKDKKVKKQDKEEKTRKTKKQKHQDKNDENNGEPSPKSPKTKIISDNLGNLNLGDNTHILTDLIDQMAVVDKAKNKKLRKTANRETKLTQNETDLKRQPQNETAKHQAENETDDKNDIQAEKKKWVAKRWNKHQVAERSLSTTVNVDNLPASLLKGNFKKVLIDHFAKYGLQRSVGEPLIQNEENPNPVFSTKVHFNSSEAAAEALEMDSTSVAGNEIRVSPTRPMLETVLVVRIYGHPDKLTDKDIKAAFGEIGVIRSIKPMLRKKKTMTTAFVEFEGPDTVNQALQKCEGLIINGKKVMASPFTDRSTEQSMLRRKRSKKRGASGGPKGTSEDSDQSDDE